MNFDLNVLIFDLSSEEYHSAPDSVSSSQLKEMLKGKRSFYRKYVSKEVAKEEGGHFDVGTYYHTAILEPHKLKQECIVYPGKIRRGDEWEKFKAKNKNKVIITKKELDDANTLITATKKSNIAMKYVKAGKKEVSLFQELTVAEGNIYAVDQELLMTDEGWVRTKKLPKDGHKIVVKVRADNMAPGLFIHDLKSTTSDAENKQAMMDSVSNFGYDLSAALYMDMFWAHFEKPMKEFIWTFASKTHANCQNYRADEDNLWIGRKKWMKAIVLLAEAQQEGWTFPEFLDTLGPNFYERQHLLKSDADLL